MKVTLCLAILALFWVAESLPLKDIPQTSLAVRQQSETAAYKSTGRGQENDRAVPGSGSVQENVTITQNSLGTVEENITIEESVRHLNREVYTNVTKEDSETANKTSVEGGEKEDEKSNLEKIEERSFISDFMKGIMDNFFISEPEVDAELELLSEGMRSIPLSQEGIIIIETFEPEQFGGNGQEFEEQTLSFPLRIGEMDMPELPLQTDELNKGGQSSKNDTGTSTDDSKIETYSQDVSGNRVRFERVTDQDLPAKETFIQDMLPVNINGIMQMMDDMEKMNEAIMERIVPGVHVPMGHIKANDLAETRGEPFKKAAVLENKLDDKS